VITNRAPRRIVPAVLLAGLGALTVALAGCGNDETTQPTPQPTGYIEMKTPQFSVPLGSEVQKNFYMVLPSDEAVYVHRVHLFMTEGSHHFNVYKLPKESGEPFTEGDIESNFSGRFFEPPWQLVIDNQSGDIDWTLPEGVAFKLEAHEQLNLQLHYTNTIVQETPGVGEGTIRWYTVPEESVTAYGGALFAWNPNIVLLPNSSASFTKRCIVPQTINLMAMTGHFHSRGKSFKVWKVDAAGARVGAEIFTNTTWAEPPFADYSAQPIRIEAGEGIEYTCEYVNDTADTISFGPHNIYQEHSNIFSFFFPNVNGNINFLGSDSVEVGVLAGGN